MIVAEISIDSGSLDAFRRALPPALASEMGKSLRRIGIDMDAEMAKRFRGQLDADCRNPGSILASRTGVLERSVAWQVTSAQASADGAVLSVYVGGPGIPYARVQEYGATIVGRPWLTIPLPANLTAACVTRYPSASALRAQGNTFVTTGSGGGPIIGHRLSGGSVEWLWVLVHQVQIPARMGFGLTWLGPAMSASRLNHIRGGFIRALRRAISAAGVKGSLRAPREL